MSLNYDSKHYKAYIKHVLEKEKATGTIGIVYDLIDDISDRRGLKHEWNQIDGEVQDEIINAWVKIVENRNSK
jgi:hypothetical protein